MVKRGIKLILLNLILNMGIFIIPYFIGGYILDMWDVFDIHRGLLLFFGDILIFAGLAYILIAVFKKYNLSNRQMLAVAVVMSVIGSLVRFADFANPFLNMV